MKKKGKQQRSCDNQVLVCETIKSREMDKSMHTYKKNNRLKRRKEKRVKRRGKAKKIGK
jgi:hypothetical protein